MDIQSKLIERAVGELARLPGLGRKSALRNVLYLLQKDKNIALGIADALRDMVENIRRCKQCHNFCESELCSICTDPRRDESLICIVEDIRDVMAIENTGQFKGLYHVLGGLISPMDGIGPQQLNFHNLDERLSSGKIKEVLLALSATAEGDTTNFFIFRKLSQHNIRVTTIARGISVGDELEYADEITLARSIANRIEYNGK